MNRPLLLILLTLVSCRHTDIQGHAGMRDSSAIRVDTLSSRDTEPCIKTAPGLIFVSSRFDI